MEKRESEHVHREVNEVKQDQSILQVLGLPGKDKEN